MTVGCHSVDSRVAHRQIIECAMLIRGTRIVCQLHDPIKQFSSRWFKLLYGRLLRERDGRISESTSKE